MKLLAVFNHEDPSNSPGASRFVVEEANWSERLQLGVGLDDSNKEIDPFAIMLSQIRWFDHQSAKCAKIADEHNAVCRDRLAHDYENRNSSARELHFRSFSIFAFRGTRRAFRQRQRSIAAIDERKL